MSVSDDSHGKPDRRLRPLTPDQWRLARIQFETGDRMMTHLRIAQIFETSISSVQKKAAAEKWSKTSNIVADARRQLQSETDRHLAIATDKAGAEIAKSLLADLQPFIEREKRSQIQRAIKRSKRAQKRLDNVALGFKVYDSKAGELVDLTPGPKDEMAIANAEDKYDSIIRRNLGMNDSQPVATPLSPILISHSAVKIEQA